MEYQDGGGLVVEAHPRDVEREELEKAKLRLEVAKLEDDLKGQMARGHLHHRVVPFLETVTDSSVKYAIRDLNELAAADMEEPVELVITSPGGSIFAGMALFDHVRWLRSAGLRVDTTALGWSASMAGILLQAGETRRIGHNSWLMIHEASMSLFGAKTSEFRDETELLKRLEDQVLGIFAERSGRPAEWIKEQFHRRDWWLSADEAVANGFADEVA